MAKNEFDLDNLGSLDFGDLDNMDDMEFDPFEQVTISRPLSFCSPGLPGVQS